MHKDIQWLKTDGYILGPCIICHMDMPVNTNIRNEDKNQLKSNTLKKALIQPKYVFIFWEYEIKGQYETIEAMIQ